VSPRRWTNRRLAGLLIGVAGLLYAASVAIILVRN
jgi:hypothetical protein